MLRLCHGCVTVVSRLCHGCARGEHHQAIEDKWNLEIRDPNIRAIYAERQWHLPVYMGIIGYTGLSRRQGWELQRQAAVRGAEHLRQLQASGESLIASSQRNLPIEMCALPEGQPIDLTNGAIDQPTRPSAPNLVASSCNAEVCHY